MIKILLDTNIFIYLEDNKIIEDKVLELTKRLFDSNDYKIVIHPDTKKEIENFENKEQKNIFKSKIAVYREIQDPPRANESFNKKVGCKNSHDEVDNNMLFAVYRNCVNYLITNDLKLKKKSKIINLDSKVLTIDEALETFKTVEEPIIKKPPFITKEYLYNIDIEDPFFDSLKEDYKSFEQWFIKKREKEAMAYVTKKGNNISSFLMLKVEDEKEDYSKMHKPLEPKKRLKVSTMKVADTGKKIGETFIKIMVSSAIENNLDEIYITVFKKQQHLIDMILEYGFKEYTYQMTEKKDGSFEKEYIYVKKAKPVEEYYPFISLKNKKFFLVPIQEEFHNILFQESEKSYQMNFDDINGMNTASNCLRKAYLCDSHIKKVTSGSVLLFYSSGVKKAITSIGIVDAVFNRFNDFGDMFKLVRKRTAYDENILKDKFKKDKLVILFKLYYPLPNYVSFDFLKRNNIVTGPIQTISEIDINKFLLILNECKLEKEKYIIE